ncbi:hypothetical protein DU002_15425 [Corallincola holothuriorum]|uniref:PepSY domain-containing protein n=1 Tax=Corallincola holothuriorum TaxID=2282215 RepID=A0A368N4G9_9GAMM|nr:PepSY-associated TM helix domain-containing protein [Corallincola holothuriorum]RCU45447.1 hypothetical protein DU002_15425 [Corallincola holothuriorum]
MARVLRALHWWHRKLGLAAALFIFLLSLTGIALNHTDGLKLSQHNLDWPWLLRWYGIESPQPQAYPVAGDWLIVQGQQLYLNEQPLIAVDGDVVGALVWQTMLLVATDKQLLLLTEEGELAEKVSAELGWPQGVTAMGLDEQLVPTIRIEQQLAQADEDLLAWHPVTQAEVNWSSPAAIPEDLAQALPAHGAVDLERVLLDLHSGRIVGVSGPWLMDMAAVAMMLLAASGIWMWAMRRRGNRRR